MSKQFLAVFCTALLLCGAAGQLGAAPARHSLAGRMQILPMRFYGTRPAVEVRVNGQGPFLFLIDTGAAGAARADTSLVRRLGLAAAGGALASDAGGPAAAIDRVMLQRIELGSMAFNNIEAYARDYNGSTFLPRIDGILGFDFFRDDLLTLDFAHRQVRIGAGSLPPADGQTILDYTLVEGNPAITIRIGERPYQVLLDTGNIRALDLPSEWLRSMPLASFARAVGTGASVSGTTGLREVRLAEALSIGRYRFAQPLVTFADENPAGNLGSSLLRNFTITIDQRHRRVRLIAHPGRLASQ